MRLPALILLVLPVVFPAGASAQATLNKCIDTEGRVTYSNLPCRGAREVKKVEIDPPPPPRPTPVVPAPAPAPEPAPAAGPSSGATPAPTPAPATPPVTPAAVEPAPEPTPPVAQPALPRPSATAPLPAGSPPPRAAPPQTTPPRAARPAAAVTPRTCDALSEQLGRVLDQMDAARGKGTTQKQLDAWTQEIQTLERRKTEAGCF